MNNTNLRKLEKQAAMMSTVNNWGEDAFIINTNILEIDHKNCAAYTRIAKYYKLNNNIADAKSMYLKVLDIDPNSRIAINNLIAFEKAQKESDAINKKNTMAIVAAEEKSLKTKEKKKK